MDVGEKTLQKKIFLFCSQSIIIDILLKTLRINIKIKLNYVVGWKSRSFEQGCGNIWPKIWIF